MSHVLSRAAEKRRSRMLRRRQLLCEALEDRLPLTSQWEEIVPTTLPPARQDHTMASIAGTPYVFGGRSFDGGNNNLPMNDLWKFNNVVDGFEQILANNAPPSARYGHGMAELDGKLYVMGGFGDSGLEDDVWEYDPAQNAWTELVVAGAEPEPRVFHSVVASGDELFVYGGTDLNGDALGDLWSFDVTTSSWTEQTGDLVRQGHSASAADGDMLVFGGRSDFGPRDTLSEYDPITDSWVEITPGGAGGGVGNLSPSARSYHVAVAEGNRFFVFGGEGLTSNVSLKDSWKFKEDSTWEQQEDLPEELKRSAGALFFSAESSPPPVNNVVAEGEGSEDQPLALLFGGRIDDPPSDRAFLFDSNVFYARAPEGNGADAVTIQVNSAAGTLEVVDDASGTILKSEPVANITGIVLEGANNEDDTATLDLTNLPTLMKGIEFRGGVAGNDTLVLTGSGTFDTITHVADNSSDGSIQLDTQLITHPPPEPIVDNLDAVNRVFNFGNSDDVIILDTGDDSLDDILRIDSNNSEVVDFVKPRGSITINAAGGGDALTIDAGDELADRDLFVELGDGSDTFDVSGSPSSLDVDAGSGDDVVNTSPGNDIINTGLGDDRVIFTPGGNDQLKDDGGNDTIDFSPVDDVDFDLNSSAIQVLDEDGSTIQIIDASEFENAKGSSRGFGLHITGDVESPTDRIIEAGAGTNRVVVNADGNDARFDGTTVIFPGSSAAGIGVAGIDDVTVVNSAPRIIDNADAGFTSQGFFATQPHLNLGFRGTHAFAGGQATDIATWTFTDVAPGFYQVAATWVTSPEHASVAQYIIRDDGEIAAFQFVNQEQPPSEFEDQGATWNTLAFAEVRSGTLTVTLISAGPGDDPSEFLSADAIRIESASPLDGFSPIIIDDEPNRPASDPSTPMQFSFTGDATQTTTFIDSFRTALAGVNNGNAIGPLTSGYREINWDDVPDEHATPNNLPRGFYNSDGLNRGVELSVLSNLSGGLDGPFRVSSIPLERFDDINPTYSETFTAFSGERLASPVEFESELLDIKFFVPGTYVPAAVRGFGAVFNDVDLQHSATVRFYDQSGSVIRSLSVKNQINDSSFSFAGLVYDDPIIARVTIDLENVIAALFKDLSQGGMTDLVVIDDFIFGEPVALTDPVPTEIFSTDCLPFSGVGGLFGDRHDCPPGSAASWIFRDLEPRSYNVRIRDDGQPNQPDGRIATIVGGEEELVVDLDQLDTEPDARGFRDITRVDVPASRSSVTIDVDFGGFESGDVSRWADAATLENAPKLSVTDSLNQAVASQSVIDLGRLVLDPDTGEARGSKTLFVSNAGSAYLIVDQIKVETMNGTPAGNAFSLAEPISFDQRLALAPLATGSTAMPPRYHLTPTFVGMQTGMFEGELTFRTTDINNKQFTVKFVAEVVDANANPTVSFTGTTAILQSEVDDLVLTVDSVEQGRFPISTTESLTILGDDADQHLLIDFIGGTPIPSSGVRYAGGGPNDNDTLAVTGGNPLFVGYTFVNATDGFIQIDGSQIAFEGLEPIIDNLNAVDRSFTFPDSADNIVFNTGDLDMDDVLRIDSNNSEVVDFIEPTGSLTVNFGDGDDGFVLDLPIDKLPVTNGGAGNDDQIILVGANQILDLTSIADADLAEINAIDITGSGDNTLTLNVEEVQNISTSSDQLKVISNLGDMVNIGVGWTMLTPATLNDVFFRVLEQDGARLLLAGPADHHNPVMNLDVDNNGSVEPIDALLTINEQNNRRLSDASTFAIDPVTLNSDADPTNDFDNRYRDVNGDGQIIPLDTLLIINFLNQLLSAAGESDVDAPPGMAVIPDAAQLARVSTEPLKQSVTSTDDATLRTPTPLRPTLVRKVWREWCFARSPGDSKALGHFFDAQRSAEELVAVTSPVF